MRSTILNLPCKWPHQFTLRVVVVLIRRINYHHPPQCLHTLVAISVKFIWWRTGWTKDLCTLHIGPESLPTAFEFDWQQLPPVWRVICTLKPFLFETDPALCLLVCPRGKGVGYDLHPIGSLMTRAADTLRLRTRGWPTSILISSCNLTTGLLFAPVTVCEFGHEELTEEPCVWVRLVMETLTCNTLTTVMKQENTICKLIYCSP